MSTTRKRRCPSETCQVVTYWSTEYRDDPDAPAGELGSIERPRPVWVCHNCGRVEPKQAPKPRISRKRAARRTMIKRLLPGLAPDRMRDVTDSIDSVLDIDKREVQP